VLQQWSTPDAYQGEVGDPVSQQSYMWNRSNPYMFTDPSGYETGWVSTVGGPNLVTPQQLASAAKATGDFITHSAAQLLGLEPMCRAGIQCGAGPLGGLRGIGKAAEWAGGELSESGFLRAAEKFLGGGYEEKGNGRFVSGDGLRQVRFGAHETEDAAKIHAHFETYDKPAEQGGRVIENTSVKIVPDPRSGPGYQ
jgi:hypothetical protein